MKSTWVSKHRCPKTGLGMKWTHEQSGMHAVIKLRPEKVKKFEQPTPRRKPK